MQAHLPLGMADDGIPVNVLARYHVVMSNGVVLLLSRGVSLDCFLNLTARIRLPWPAQDSPLNVAEGLRGVEAIFIPDFTIQITRPGDILVVDGSGDQIRAIIDGIMRATALKAGIAKKWAPDGNHRLNPTEDQLVSQDSTVFGPCSAFHCFSVL